MRLQLPATAITGALATVPLFSNVASGATAPIIHLKLKGEITSSGGTDYSLTPVIGGTTFTNQSTGNMDRFEWIRCIFGLIQSRTKSGIESNNVGLRIQAASSKTHPQRWYWTGFSVHRQSLNSVSAAGPIITNADQSFDVATVRVWLEPPINNASGLCLCRFPLIWTRRPGWRI